MQLRPQISHALIAILVCAQSAGFAQGPAGPTLNAKLAESLMGPKTDRMVLSEDGDHLAIVTAKGSRQIVLLDGVEGPVFDEIPANFGWGNYRLNGGPIAFSPTGGRSAYVGRRAGDFIAVVDGKEAVTLMTPATAVGIGYTDPLAWRFIFSRDGSRLAYAAREATSWVMMVDGVKSPSYKGLDMTQAVLNGKRLFYVAQTPADQKWHLVVDGKAGPAYDTIRSLKVTPDGAHYAFIIEKRSPTARPAAVVIDGVEGVTEKEISELEQAPDGRVAYMATRAQTRPGVGGNPPHLIVGALDADWTTTFGYPVFGVNNPPQMHVAWSADGKRFAYIQRNDPNPGVTMMVNGKAMGPTYNSTSAPFWSPDGSRLAYVGNSPSGAFPVIDGQELEGYTWVKDFKWSPDGKRYGFQGANATGIWMVIDGKQQPKSLGVQDGTLTWSPDGKHVAYSSQTTGSGYQPMVDLVVQPHNLGTFHARVLNNRNLFFPPLIYSPDGSRLAYVGTTAGMPRAAVWVNGVAQQGPMPSYFHPNWSPDSKHFAAVTSSGTLWVIMIDGKLSPGYEDILELNLASDRFIDGHTFRFYGIKAGQVYRVTLDLGA